MFLVRVIAIYIFVVYAHQNIWKEGGSFSYEAGYILFSILTAAISLVGFFIIKNYCFVFRKNKGSNIQINFLEWFFSPAFLLYSFGLPILGTGFFSVKYMLFLVVSAFLASDIKGSIREKFWKYRRGEFEHVPDSGNASRREVEKYGRVIFSMLFLLPIFGRIIYYIFPHTA